MSRDVELLVGLSVEELEALADSFLAPRPRHDSTICWPVATTSSFPQARSES
jgi:hypothetical protein